MMKPSEVLDQVSRLNNEGANMLSTAGEDAFAIQLAMERFEIAITASLHLAEQQRSHCVISVSSLENSASSCVANCCHFTPVPDLQGEDQHDTSFYIFHNAIHLRIEEFSQPTTEESESEQSTSSQSASEATHFAVAVLLMNMALAHYQMGQVCVKRHQTTEAMSHFHHSVDLYAQMYISLAGRPIPFTWSDNAIFLFMLAAQNNYSIICCLQLELPDQCRLVQEGLHTLIQVGRRTLPSDVSGMVEEIYLNTTVLSATDCFTKLPAAAA